MDLVVEVYALCKRFPREERYNLTAQMRRAAVSIPSNIAEGQGRYTTPENRQFVITARGSLLELETQILLAARLGYLDSETLRKFMESSGEIGRQLNGLVRYLSQPEPPRPEIQDP